MLKTSSTFSVGLVALLALVVGTADAGGSSSGCQDDPTYRHWGSPYRDCEWIVDMGKCDWGSSSNHDNDKTVGEEYCPVSCDRCPPGTNVTQNLVSVENTCFHYGEDIVVSFANTHPRIDDWVGIYPSSISDAHLQDDYSLWLFLCGDQHNLCAVSYGMLTFGSGYPTESGTTDFPLHPGTYVAYMLLDGLQGPYTPLANSRTFEVKPQGESCGDGAQTPPPTLAPSEEEVVVHPTPMPVHYYPGPPTPAHPSPPTPDLTPTPSAAPSSSDVCIETIETDKSCYKKGEAITVTFNQCDNAEHNDWVGVYYADDGGAGDLIGDDFRFWVWACGTQSCTGTTNSNTIVFDENPPRESGKDTWPLNVNPIEGYRVHLIRYDYTVYESYLASDTFVVLRENASCDDASDTHPPSSPPVPHPTEAPPHPMPTHAPVIAPTPACVSQVETDETCYAREAGDDIVIDFTNCDGESTNWVGIYDAHDDPEMLGEPLYWVWLCSGSQTSCGSSVPVPESGTITIDNHILVDKELRGEYRAHLIESANPSSGGSHYYMAYASSEAFSVEKKANRCDDHY
jgi:hypothetical protein